MRLLAVVGPGAGEAADRIADRLQDRGPVARVIGDGRADGGQLLDRPAASTTQYRLGPTGWTAAGTDLKLDELIDRLAVDHDYAVISGRRDVSVPTVAIDGATTNGTTIYEAPDVAAIDVNEVCAALEALEPYETLRSIIERVTESPGAERAGAIATFTGRVRAKDDPDDVRTLHLEYDRYEGLAEERMATIEQELTARSGVEAVALHHRTGIVAAGEPSVFVVVLAGHRAEAFETVSDGIDRLKDEVPIFKKEVTVEGETWAHDRP